MDASLVIKLGDFVNVSVDLSPSKTSHGGKGFVTGKETKDGVSTFTMKYLETVAGSSSRAEANILVSRLTVAPLAMSGDGPKLRVGNPVVAPDDDSTTAKHSTISLKVHLQEGFLNGWAKVWRRRDFQKRSMSRANAAGPSWPVQTNQSKRRSTLYS